MVTEVLGEPEEGVNPVMLARPLTVSVVVPVLVTTGKEEMILTEYPDPEARLVGKIPVMVPTEEVEVSVPIIVGAEKLPDASEISRLKEFPAKNVPVPVNGTDIAAPAQKEVGDTEVTVSVGVQKFNRTETFALPKFAVAKSCFPSPLKSPTATEYGSGPVG